MTYDLFHWCYSGRL